MNIYGAISIIFAVLLCVPFFFWFERNKKSSKELALIAVMTAVATLSRLIFFATPNFKPIGAMVIIAGAYLGCKSGFLTGAMSMLISNFFFGQGPWTAFQMLAFGILGFLSGIFGRFIMVKGQNVAIWATFCVIFGVFGGILYSCLVDIWTVLAFMGNFNLKFYLSALVVAIPVTIQYCISNTIFLLILNKPIGEKLQRINQKFM